MLNRQLAAAAKHTKWVTEVTEFAIGASKVYLSPVLNLYDNRVVSAVSGPSPSVKMVTDGLRTAIDSLQPGSRPEQTLPDDLLAVENELNLRPRLVLNNCAPADLFASLPASQNQSVLRR